MNDVKIGQYVPANSVIHKLNPMVKIMSLFIIII